MTDIYLLAITQCHNAEQLYIWLLHFIANNYLIFSHKPDFLELSGQYRQWMFKCLCLINCPMFFNCILILKWNMVNIIYRSTVLAAAGLKYFTLAVMICRCSLEHLHTPSLVYINIAHTLVKYFFFYSGLAKRNIKTYSHLVTVAYLIDICKLLHTALV